MPGILLPVNFATRGPEGRPSWRFARDGFVLVFGGRIPFEMGFRVQGFHARPLSPNLMR